MKTVQMTMDEILLERVDSLVELAGTTRSDFIREALRHEIKRLENERLEQEHRTSFERDPQNADESWMPSKRAWGDLDKRPVVILTRDALIPHLSNLSVAPLTTRARGISSQVILETFDGIAERSAISLDNIQTIPKESLNSFVVSLSRTRLREIQRAVTFALELDLFDEEI
jgi:mRNA interferase MazF